MLVPNRHGSSSTYRYGFQGQEKDDELKGEGNSLNYTFRMHDPRVGRFFAVDPLTHKYPWYTPYQFSGNKVIQYVELEGLEEGNTNTGSSGALDLNQGGAFAYDPFDEVLNGGTLKEIIVTGTVKSPSSGSSSIGTSEFGFWDRVDQGNTPVKIDNTQKPVSGADEMKRLSRDKWTPEQADAFHSDFKKGKAATNGYTDPLVGILAIGVAPVPIAMFGAPATLQTMLAKTGISVTVQYTLTGKVNGVSALSDGLLVPGASAVTGSSFEVNISLKDGLLVTQTRSIFGSGVHSKSIESFATEASVGLVFGSRNGYFSKIVNKSEADIFAKDIAKGFLETSAQFGSYGVQNQINK